MKIAIAVHGRFHAFDLARALLACGHNVTLFTNYPGWAVERFGIARKQVCGFPLHGVLARVAEKLCAATRLPMPEPLLHPLFGRWVATQIRKERWDVIHCFSGVAEEVLRVPLPADTIRQLVRGSSHIRTQDRLLKEEEHRTHIPLDRPSRWMIAREEREYDLADQILVLSHFTKDSFITEGIASEKVITLGAGANTTAFRLSISIVEERRRRILSGAPIRILNVGTFSLRKGMWDMERIVQELAGRNFEFTFVGPVAPEAKDIVERLRPLARFIPKQPQDKLTEYYAWGDVFVLPTIEDGFQTVLSQAAAAALPILTTPNGAGYDLVQPGVTGWVLSIRSPKEFIDSLSWCDTHRDALSNMVKGLYDEYIPRDWSNIAARFEAICHEHLNTTNPR